MLNERARALAAKINKEVGDGTIVLASDIHIPKRFTTGSLFLDVALGGGWPGNQWVEVYGYESHGKTAIVLKTVAANQAIDPEFTTFWVASEHYDKEQAAALGVDNERVLVCDTRDMAFAYDKLIEAADSRAFDLLVLDSYPALVPPDEDDKDMDEDAQIAQGARLTGKFFRKVGFAMHRGEGERPVLGMFINQWRSKIGGWSPSPDPVTTPGGKAKNYAFFTRVKVQRDEWLETKIPGEKLKVKVGQTIKVLTEKNKAAAPQQVATVDFYFRDDPNTGMQRGQYDSDKETVLMALLWEIIERRGSRFYYKDIRWDRKEDMFLAPKRDPELKAALDAEVREIATRGKVTLTEEEVDLVSHVGQRVVKRSSDG